MRAPPRDVIGRCRVAAPVAVGFAVASPSSAPSPVCAPCADTLLGDRSTRRSRARRRSAVEQGRSRGAQAGVEPAMAAGKAQADRCHERWAINFTQLHFAECGHPPGGNRSVPTHKGPGSRPGSPRVTLRVTSFRTMRPWTGHLTPRFGRRDAVDRAARCRQRRRVLPRQGGQQRRRLLLPWSRRWIRTVTREHA